MIIVAKISIVPQPLLKQTTRIVICARHNLVNAQLMVSIFALLKISSCQVAYN
jgi:hypothetical protein